MDKNLLLQMTADIVAAHASMNELGMTDLLGEIDQVYKKLSGLADEMGDDVAAAMAGPDAPALGKPAVPKHAAFGAAQIFCMVCGKGMQTLKRHLSTAHNLSPREYRKAYNIETGTPLVAKNYSAARRQLAQERNLPAQLENARAARGKNKGKTEE